VAAIADLLPVQAPLRWDVRVEGFAAILAEHPEAVARRQDGGRAMVPVLLTGGRTAGRPHDGARFSHPLAEAAPEAVR
jgi:hypothetical protein